MDACSEYIVGVNELNKHIETLVVAPNPFSQETSIFIPTTDVNDVSIIIKNVIGQEVFCPINIEIDRIIVKKGDLTAGTYFFLVKDKALIIGNGKFVVR